MLTSLSVSGFDIYKKEKLEFGKSLALRSLHHDVFLHFSKGREREREIDICREDNRY